jgi:hypothetical protein
MYINVLTIDSRTLGVHASTWAVVKVRLDGNLDAPVQVDRLPNSLCLIHHLPFERPANGSSPTNP